MTTIYVNVSKTAACARLDGRLTSGMVGIKAVFEYGPEWEGLNKTAVFTAGAVTRDVLNADVTVTVPADVLQKPNQRLYVGIYGTDADGTIVIPTVMTPVSVILPGTDPSGDPGANPELPIWAQLQAEVEKLKLEGPGAGGSITATADGDAIVITTSLPVRTEGDAIVIGGA